MIDLSGISVFVSVVETGSFTAAAGKLGQSKSAISKQVTKLEQRLGAQLLARTTRRLSLTEVGQAFYERCRRIIDEAEEAELAVSNLQQVPRGQLRLSAPFSFGVAYLTCALPDFMAQVPDLKVDIDFNDRRVDIVDEGFDMAIRIGQLPDSSLIARKISSSRILTVAAPAYWKANGVPQHPEDIASHNCLTYAYMATPNSWHFHDPDQPGQEMSVRVRGTLSSNNGNALTEAAAAGLGVVHTPGFICGQHLRSGALVEVLQDYEPEPVGIYAIYPPNRHLSAKVRSFIDFLSARFGPPNTLWP